MYAHELFENPKPRVVVTYPGRFQPFHQGHAGVFAQLQKKFGNENVFIATSNDTSSAKSPFNFSDKYQLMTAAGVPGNHIFETNAMYVLPNDFNPANTVFITAVGAPDADRLNPDTYLKRDKKDKEGNIIKPAGSPGYYKTWNPQEAPVTADQHGYVIVIPEIHKDIKINGQKYNVSHGTDCRNLWNAIRGDEKARTEFLKQLYGRPDKHLAAIFDKIPAPTQEDIDQRATDTISPIHGGVKKGTAGLVPIEEVRIIDPGKVDVYFNPDRTRFARRIVAKEIPSKAAELIINKVAEKYGRSPEDFVTVPVGKEPYRIVGEEAAGVGVVATNKKMAKDPRYSMSITKDVKPSTPKNMLRAFRLSEAWTNKYLNENINPEDFHVENTDKLDVILSYLCKMVIEGQKTNKDLFGMVAACVLDTDNRAVFGINYFNDATDNRVHAERCALDQYRAQYGEPPAGSIVLTTLSPCCHPMEERYGESCTELINDTDIHKVYCGYKDPTQEDSMNRTFHIKQTRNAGIIDLCKSFADTFLNNDLEEEWSQKYKNSINCSHPKGFSQKAHCAGKKKHNESIAENFADGRNPQDKGDSKRYNVPTKGSISSLRKIAKQGGRRGQLAHWMANMKSGRQKANENVVPSAVMNEPDFPAILAKFLPIAMKDLGIDKLPRISLEKHLETHDGQATFGRFVNDENEIHLAIADRHPIDILRTLAHELTHFRQFLNHQLKHNSGETGSPEENEAHVMAGIIMRHFDKAYPDLLKLNPLDMS